VTVPESTFTGARAYCPSPGRWSAPDSQAAEVEVSRLVAAMVTAIRPDVVLETGTYLGYTAREIGLALSRAGSGRLTTVEVDEGFAEQARVRCAGLPVTVVTGDTRVYRPAERLDFVWFDSADSIRGEEFRLYYPWMHDHTVVGFHDVGPQHVVRGQVDALVADGLLTEPTTIYTPRGVCFANVRTTNRA